MTMTITEKERLELLQKLLVERYGDLATRQEVVIPDNSNN